MTDMMNAEWVIEWIADERGNVLRKEGDNYVASYRWVLREHILTPSEAGVTVVTGKPWIEWPWDGWVR